VRDSYSEANAAAAGRRRQSRRDKNEAQEAE